MHVVIDTLPSGLIMLSYWMYVLVLYSFGLIVEEKGTKLSTSYAYRATSAE